MMLKMACVASAVMCLILAVASCVAFLVFLTMAVISPFNYGYVALAFVGVLGGFLFFILYADLWDMTSEVAK